MSKILLIDVDSKIPNLALMKLSTYHKNKGDQVDLKKLNISYYPSKNKYKLVNGEGYDKIYGSIIFSCNFGNVGVKTDGQRVEFGGSGVSFDTLPDYIDNLEPDYSIYPDNDISYGFITRGCIRNCDFCIVRKKEGYLYKYRNPGQIVKHKIFEFLDNNLLAYDDHLNVLQWFVDNKITCRVNQGLDIRLINHDNLKLLSEMKIQGEYVFAFDDIKLENIINNKLKLIKKYIKKDWKLKFFIYCNPKMDIVNDVVYRVKWCKDNKVLPYLMRDLSCWGSMCSKFYVDLAAYCNQPSLFKKLSFKEFLIKRHPKDKKRQNNSLTMWGDQSWKKM